MKKLSLNKLLTISVLLISGCSNPFGKKSLIDVSSVTHLSWDKTNYNYGSVNLGSEVEETFVYKNTGSLDALNCGPVTLSDTTNFGIVNDGCVSSEMHPNESCNVTIKTKPENLGTISLSLSRTCEYGSVARTSTSLVQVVSKTPIIEWATTSYDFGVVPVGEDSLSKTFVLSSKSNIPVVNCGLVQISDVTNFRIVSDTCGLSDLPVNGTCSVTIKATPQSEGSNMSAQLSRNCSGRGSVSTQLGGIKVTGEVPSLSLSDTSYDFGGVAVGSDSTQKALIFKNNATVAAAKNCGAVSLTNSADFTVVSNSCGTNNLNAGSSCSVVIKANPSIAGLRTTTISRSCAIGGDFYFNPNGLSVTGLAPNLTLDILSYNFGSVTTGDTSSGQTFTFSNNGTLNASGCSAPLLSNNSDFTVTSDQCSTDDLNVGNSCSITVVANPSGRGLKSATLTRQCGVGGVVSSSANGLTATGVLSADWKQEYGLSSLGYVRSSGGVSNTYKFYFRNTNSDSLTGCSLATLSNTLDFSIISDDCGTNNMDMATACTVEVRAHPVNLGSVSTLLTRSCSEVGAVTTTVTAVGTNSSLAVNISSSFDMDAALLTDGSVKYWNIYSDSQPTPKDLSISGVSKVSGSCALKNDGTVSCWDYAGNVTAMSSLAGVIDIEANEYRGCAVLSGGSVKCWGSNSSGQLGDGTTDYSPNPVSVLNVSNANKIYVRNYLSCAILTDKTVKCWGVGYGSNPVVLSGYTDVVDLSFHSLDYGFAHGCAVLGDGRVNCWGDVYYGYTNWVTGIIPGISNAVSIAVGIRNACASLADGSVKCWGDNGDASLGDGTIVSTSNPITVPGLFNIKKVVKKSDDLTTCALSNNGDSYCWGSLSRSNSPSYGDLSLSYRTLAKPISGLTNVISAAVGEGYSGYTCAVLSDGTVRCWGENNSGSLGVGDYWPRPLPTQLPSIANAKDVVLGSNFGCALLTAGSVKCWGGNESGQLGDGTNSLRLTPVTVSGIANATAISAGSGFVCALLSDQTVKCWGGNYSGQLGNGDTDNQNTPVAVTDLTNVVKISVANDHACALVNDGTVKCWGDSLGQTSSLTPVLIADLSNVSDISLGGRNNANCAILSNKTVKCWNSSGTKNLINGLSDVEELELSGWVSCARTSSGYKKCWGYNYSAEIGDADRPNSLVARPVFSLNQKNIIKLSKGNALHNCSIDVSGQLFCNGRNSMNQTGFNELYLRKVSGL